MSYLDNTGLAYFWSKVKNYVSSNISDFVTVDDIYPVGSIYMSVSSTSPDTLFGGTWTQIEDTFLLSAGSTYTAGDTGGEATHTLSSNEMPSHFHAPYKAWRGNWNYNSSGNVVVPCHYTNSGSSNVGAGDNNYIRNVGSGNAHNNMPPYLVVYVWKRVS